MTANAEKKATISGAEKKRGPCQYAEIQPNRAGKIVMRADAVWPCSAPLPDLPALPVSITKSYGYNWPPRRTYVDRDDCADCPCWTPREVLPPVDHVAAAVADGWIRHDGGERPVGPKDRVHFRTLQELADTRPNISENADGRAADTLRWEWKTFADSDPHNDNIAVYKVVG
ncbi:MULTISPECIES: hypothetical protein [unclassified Mesorhizobium]|uniref:hypothetical protein n=1 Tax=unclassified Mesorhizobium TaxID=325217 RepID=UPI001093F1DF|nr:MULTISPECIES: hypothetical protein [unclassified Mesorhizobium]TGT90883.1 hypothetical protein EN804_05980 [Mesorhizobium sp. M8A.F.Ca.ET.161.01.1.1]TGV43837.1 hypothetical protein EN785_07565 [Mesorhizobium sp. M8A.F.Ca.ET.142.01.1.1]